MDWSDAIVAVIVCSITAFASWASQRSAAKASEKNTSSTNAAKLLEQAYERARALDVETNNLLRQEIANVRQEFHEREDELLTQIMVLERKVKFLEETQN